jgi:CHAD domain-containing protein
MTNSGMADPVVTTETRQFAGEQTGRLLRHLAFQINHTVKSCDPESIHDVRVAIRRFTQAVAVFKPCFPGKEMRKIRRRLKKVMAVAGEVRNYDVALKLTGKSNVPELAQIQSKLRSRRKESVRVLVSELKSWTERQMSLKWRAALEAANSRNEESFGRAAIEGTARRTLRRMMKDLFQHGNEAAGSKASPDDLHVFRIAAKKFRYSLELFTPLYGPSLNRGLARMKLAQTLLGDINDCETVAKLVSQLEGGDKLASRLRKRQRRRTEEFREYWSAEFRDGEQLRSWMDHLGRPSLRQGIIRKPMARSSTLSSGSTRKPVTAAKKGRVALAATASS